MAISINTMSDPYFLPKFTNQNDAQLLYDAALIKQLSFGKKVGVIINKKIYELPISFNNIKDTNDTNDIKIL
jgi:hypothetical protein